MKKNPKDLVWLSLEELKEHFGEDGLCLACRCVAVEEDIDYLQVIVNHTAGSDVYEPVNIICMKCWQLVTESIPFVEKVFESHQLQPYPKALVWPAILRNAKSFAKRGLDPRERIKVDIREVPADFDVEQETEQFRNDLKKMKKECRSSKRPDS